MLDVTIQSGSTIYPAIVEEGATWETSRSGAPGKFEFTLLKDNVISFQEGDVVRAKMDGTGFFYGFVFRKSRDKSGTIKVLAYDQLRYLKNKDARVNPAMTGTQYIQKLVTDFRLKAGTLADTGVVIPPRLVDNQTLFDSVQEYLDLTLQASRKIHVLYDDFGALTLKPITDMRLDILIDSSTGENYEYSTSIDGETYNQIVLYYDNDKTGKREKYIAKDGSTINQWGVLQYCESIEAQTNGRVKANALLGLYNQKRRDLTVKNVFGDIRVRGGSGLIVMLDLGDIEVQKYMVVESVKHLLNAGSHTMDLSVRGWG